MPAPKTVAVIDGNSFMHRAYHAVPPTMNAPDGTPTNAVFGFISMFIKLYEQYKPDAIICAFDAGKPVHRIEAMERYKAQRPHMDEELRVQFPLMEKLLNSMNVPVVKVEGWEGDDILGTIAARDEKLGIRTLLVTGDKDANQLATELTHILTTKKGISDVIEFDPATVFEKYGVTPSQFPDFLGLMGDSSDNIPGVPGIGPKTATKLLQSYGSLEGIYNNLDKLKGKQLENLRDNKDEAYLSREVATIVCDLDFECDIEVAAFPAFDPEEVKSAFGELQLTMHMRKILALSGEDGACDTALKIDVDNIADATQGGSAAKRASTLIDDAIAAGETIGVSWAQPTQATLFDPEPLYAFACGKGVACFEGEQGERVLARIVREGRVAAADLHELLRRVYPADGAEPTLVDAGDLAQMDGFDLGLAGYVLNSINAPYTLDSLAETFAGAVIPQSDDDRRQCAVNAAAARVLVPILREQLEKSGDWGVYADIDLPLVGVLVSMERTGAALDAETLADLGRTTAIELESLRARIIEMAGEEFNVDSPKQLGHILFEVMGLPPKKKTTRGFSTDASVLKELAREGAEIAALILRYRELAKIKSTYIDALPRMRAGDGRVHTTFNETVTATGRLSSSDPNLQNIPVRTDFGRKIRACFVPLEPGHVFVGADYSQIELRLLAHLSGDEGLVAAFNSGRDFHTATAAAVFGLDPAEVTPQLRSRAKAVNFGIVYGQQAFGLSQSLEIPFGEAKDMIDRYFATYPGVRSYLDGVVEDARLAGYAETMFGRKRHIPELHARNQAQRSFGERTAMNHPMQGTAADIIKMAMVQIRDRIACEGLRAKMMLQVHDELDFSCPAEEVEQLSALAREVMENVVSLSVPLLVDVSYGSTWADAH